MKVYAPGVATDGHTLTQPTPGSHRGKFRRRPPSSKVEQARRKAWGKQWGSVGAEYAKQLRAKEGR